MSVLLDHLLAIDVNEYVSKQEIVDNIKSCMESKGYKTVEINVDKPWGAYLKFDNYNAESFVSDFFPGLGMHEAKLGNDQAELSPKILIVSPNQRLSWQLHARRAERWAFLTDGFCNRSETDDEGDVSVMKAGGVAQFSCRERHRLIGREGLYTLVAEIWQHTDANDLSIEDDIVRLADDYARETDHKLYQTDEFLHLTKSTT